MFKILVQNYYERTGSFKGIENTYLCDELVRLHKETGKSVFNICYELLGYTGAKSAESYASLRNKILKNYGWKSMLTEKKTIDELVKVFKMNTNTKEVSLIKDGKLKGLDKLVAAYYKNDVYNRVVDENNLSIPFGIWLQQQTMPVSKILESPIAAPCLVQIEQKEIEYPTIYGKVLYCSEKLSESEKKKLQLSAIRQVMFYGSPLKKWSKLPIVELLTMSSSHPDIYLQMLDYARYHKMSYAELMQNFDISIPNLVEGYRTTGMIFMTLNDKVMYYDKETGIWCLTQTEMFVNYCNDHNSVNLENFGTVLDSTIKYPFIKENDHELHCF